LGELFAHARNEIVVCSPYIGRDGTDLLASRVADGFCFSGRLTFITDLSLTNVCQRATDPFALKGLAERFGSVKVWHLSGVHAKVYLADDDLAIVTSGNLTGGGLSRNFEYGVELSEPSLTQKVKKDVLDYGALGADVTPDHLDALCHAADELRNLFEQQHRSIKREIRRKFEASFRAAQDQLIRLRLARGPIHRVFAQTIEYLLQSRGPMTTEQMHPLIQAVHPDLCDDSVDRVIDGKHFGKKWKHAARTAQQQLKKRGLVKYEDGQWWLT
jgi:hypothetical protein